MQFDLFVYKSPYDFERDSKEQLLHKDHKSDIKI